MKTRIKYYWLCTYKTAGGVKTVIIGNEKTNTPKYFPSPESAAKFLKKTGLADNMLLCKCRCELKAVEV